MYHAIVARLTRRTLHQVNTRDVDGIIAACRPDVRHRFGGEHALGGERQGADAVRRWFERLGRLVPDLKLVPTDIWVKGWPWDTTALVRWNGSGTYPDGSPYRNHGVHVVQLRWGKVAAIDANEDSQAVDRLLHAKAADGVEEAAAPPILS